MFVKVFNYYKLKLVFLLHVISFWTVKTVVRVVFVEIIYNTTPKLKKQNPTEGHKL